MRHRAKLRAARKSLPLHHHYVIRLLRNHVQIHMEMEQLARSAPRYASAHPLILPTFVAMEAAPPRRHSSDAGCASHFKPTAPWTWESTPTPDCRCVSSFRHYASIGGGPMKKCLLLSASSVNLPRCCLQIAAKTHSFRPCDFH